MHPIFAYILMAHLIENPHCMFSMSALSVSSYHDGPTINALFHKFIKHLACILQSPAVSIHTQEVVRHRFILLNPALDYDRGEPAVGYR